MFSGIIETLGTITEIRKEQQNKRFVIEAEFIKELYKGQSISVNGACLTVEKINENSFEVVAVKETIRKTNLDLLEISNKVNLERALAIGARLDGHFVLGHVDTTTKLVNIKEVKGSFEFEFEIPIEGKKYIIPKGSIAINGTSLTIAEIGDRTFKVTVIPFTYKHTTFGFLKQGDTVNIEYDVLGKYVVSLFNKK